MCQQSVVNYSCTLFGSFTMVMLYLLFVEEASGICRPWNKSNNVYRLSGTSGTFFSPDYPVPYPKDVRCIWKISVPAGKVVKLTFVNFKLKLDPEDCKRRMNDSDRVQVRDGKAKRKAKKPKTFAVYCGYYAFMGPPDVYSTGNYMSVIFQSISDSEESARGFKARFEAVDPKSKY